MGKIIKEMDGNGFLHLKGVKISRVQVAPYLGRQIDAKNRMGLEEPLSPNEIYGVYRSADELFDPKAMATFEGMPFRVGHQMLGQGAAVNGRVKKADNENIDGCFLNIRRSEDDGEFLLADIVIYTERALKAIANGTKELSLGYVCRYVPVDTYPEPKYYKGEPYLFEQTNIRANHLALVPHGRAGSEVCVEDAAIHVNDGLVVTCDSLPEEIRIMDNDEMTAKEALVALLNGSEEDIQNCLDYCALSAEQKAKIKGVKGETADEKPIPPPPQKEEKPEGDDAGEGEGEGKPLPAAGENKEETAPQAEAKEDAPAETPAPAPVEKPVGEESAPAPAPAPEKKDDENAPAPTQDTCPCCAQDEKPKLYSQDELDEAVKKAAAEALIKGRKEGCRGRMLANAMGVEAEDGMSEAEVAHCACRKIPELKFAEDASDDVAIAACRAHLGTKAKSVKKDVQDCGNAPAGKSKPAAPVRKTLLSEAQDEAIAKTPTSLSSARLTQFLANH